MRLMFAGGGTGGHLMVGLGVAVHIKNQFPDSEIRFFITGKDVEMRCISKRGFDVLPLYVSPWKKSITQIPKFAFRQLKGIFHSLTTVKQFAPDMVIGLGGYSSVPPLVSARLLGIPYVILEQNVIPGKANRLMSRWASGIYSHWEQSLKWFKCTNKFKATGTPIRSSILNVDRVEAAEALHLSLSKKTLLVMGGSQGARAINDAVLQCLPEFEKLAQTLQIIHCTGDSEYERVKAIYDSVNIDAVVCGFLDNMGAAYGLADLVICRAGATTIAEVTAVGIPAVFIPYPFASDNHQYWNAKAIADKGGGVVIEEAELTPQILKEMAMDIIQDGQKHAAMKDTSKSLGKPDATAVISNLIQSTFGRSKNTAKKTLLLPLFLTLWTRRAL